MTSVTDDVTNGRANPHVLSHTVPQRLLSRLRRDDVTQRCHDDEKTTEQTHLCHCHSTLKDFRRLARLYIYDYSSMVMYRLQ